MLTELGNIARKRQISDDKFVVVSSFTLDTPYEDEIRRLLKGLELFKLNHIIYVLPDHGDWLKNCHHIIQTISHALELQDKHVLWVDADAEVKGRLPLFNDFQHDLGAYKRKNKRDAGYHLDTGTLFYANNPKVRLYIKQMAYNVAAFYAGEIEKYLDVDWMLANIELTGLDLGQIPVEYSYIFDTRQQEEVGCSPLIIHHQASRRFKGLING